MRQIRDFRKEGRHELLVLRSKLRMYKGVLNFVLALHVTKRAKAKQEFDSKLNVALLELEQSKETNLN